MSEAEISDVVMIWSTWPDAATAEKGGRALVDQRLAACVVVSPGATSIYRWQGAIETATEATMWVKTRASLADRAMRALIALHPYDVPAVVVVPVGAVHPPYAAWVEAETTSV